MQLSPSEWIPGSEIHPLLPYVTDLEFEADRLRNRGRFVELSARDAIQQTQRLCRQANRSQGAASAIPQTEKSATGFANVLSDLHEPPGFHAAHGRAVVKLLVEQSGGTLTVESVAEQGTSFVAVLPRVDVGDFLD
jgi:hypothetical protein